MFAKYLLHRQYYCISTEYKMYPIWHYNVVVKYRVKYQNKNLNNT